MRKTYKIGLPYAGDRFGGSNNSSLLMAGALRERGHQIVIMTHGEGRAMEEPRAQGFEVDVLPRLSEKPGYARPDKAELAQYLAAPTCLKAIARHKLDIVHVNDLGMLRTWAVPTALSRATLVAHWRSNYSPSRSVDFALRMAKQVISVSDYSLKQLPKWVQEKTIVEFNAVNVFRTDEERKVAAVKVRESLGVPQNAVLVATFGNLMKRKRTHLLADVIAAITHRSDGAPVYGIAAGGRAEPHDELLDKKIAEYGIADRLFLPGFVRPVEDWMAACDVALAPAEREPFGRSILEAMGVGTPVILSSDGGLVEFISDAPCGIVLDPTDTQGWINEVRGLIEDPVKAKKLATLAQAAVRDLGPARHAERIEAIYYEARS